MSPKKEKGKEKRSSTTRKVATMKGQESKTVIPAGQEGAENIDKIRDILFGSQSREFEKRIARLEETLRRELKNLESGTSQRFDSIEMYFRGEIESLSKQLKAETKDRSGADGELKDKLQNTKQLLEKKTTDLDQHMTKGQADLRQQLLDQSKRLNDDMQKKYKEITTVMEKSVRELRADKTDRLALADLLMEMALRLKDELKLPKGE